MWRFNRRMKRFLRNTAIVTLMSLSIQYPAFAEPSTEPSAILPEDVTRHYSGSEVTALIDEISLAAYEAIEKAAAESAKAATLAALEREAALMREAHYWRVEAETYQRGITEAIRAGRKNAVIAGALCLFGGFIFGVTGTLVLGR